MAPYGQAALEYLQALGSWESLQKPPRKLVRGESVAQAYQFVATGNADLGLVALSQVLNAGERGYWLVPETLYQPIIQQLVVLQESDAVIALLQFLGSNQARTIIQQAGYGLPEPG